MTADRPASVRFEAPEQDGIGRLVLDRPDDAVNAVDPGLVEDLSQAVRLARAADDLRGLIVVSAKPRHWVAGADLKMIAADQSSEQLEAVSRRFQAVLDEVAWLPCTTVAAINGPALGGGLELALACDYRVAMEAPGVSLGLPEVNLGLVPGGGGTQRLPRLLGLQPALDLILSGRQLNARRARRAGVLDEVVHPAVLEQAARSWAARPKRALDRPLRLGLSLQAAVDLAEQTPQGRQLIYRRARQAVLARTHGHYPAPLLALEAVEAGFEHGMVAGLEAEARAFGELAASETARQLIWLFLATQHRKRPPPTEGRSTDHLAVVGAGFMGAAIAEVGAAAGLQVRLRDVNPQAVARGLAAIGKMVGEGIARRRFDARAGRAVLQRVSGTTDYSGFAAMDVVIEAVFEDLAVKRQVVKDLEAVVSPQTIIASNTSALPISDIAAAASHPDRVVGMHFFSPAQRMPLLEVVRPQGASDSAVAQAVALGTLMGKTVIVVADSPGFYTSRVLGMLMNEAALMLGEGVGMQAIDAAMTGFGFPVGPFVLFDEVGLEVAQHVSETMGRAAGERVPSASIVPRLVAAGSTGRKAGTGFYLWSGPSSLPAPLRGLVKRPTHVPNPVVSHLVGQVGAAQPPDAEIQQRLVLLFVNEAMRCLEEGVLQSPTDGDLGAVLGLGFPPFTGGPFHYADSLGLERLERALRTLAGTHGSRFEPAGVLVERARAGRTFFEE